MATNHRRRPSDRLPQSLGAPVSWAVFPEAARPEARGRARGAGRPRRRPRAGGLPGAGGGRLAALRAPAARAGRADPVPARPLEAPRQAPPGRHQEARALRRPDRGGVDRPRAVLDAERQPPARGAHEAQGQVDLRHPRPRARGRLPDPRPQHGEGAQREGEVPRGHPHVPRPRRGGLEGDRGGLRVPVRGPALHHARAPLRRQAALRRRRVRADPPPRRQVPEGALARKPTPSGSGGPRWSRPRTTRSRTWWPR